MQSSLHTQQRLSLWPERMTDDRIVKMQYTHQTFANQPKRVAKAKVVMLYVAISELPPRNGGEKRPINQCLA
jgi:hypothetical protein